MQRRRMGVLSWWLGVLFLSLLAASVPAPAAVASPQSEANALVADLERDNPEYLFDMHGNAERRLQRLMVLRFDATSAVKAGIDRMDGKPRKAALVAALYHVLGFVKDPASIPWLKEKVGSPRNASAYEAYLGDWQFGYRYYSDGYGRWPWLTGRDAWIAFFIAAHGAPNTPAARRRILLNVLTGFDDPTVIRFFKARRAAARDPGEILLIEAYLHQHDVPVDDKRIARAIDALARDPEQRALLLGTATVLRHPAYVPYLIRTLDIADTHYVPADYPSVDALERITFRVGARDRAGWKAWYAKHRTETRDQWMQAAISDFRGQRARDPAAAHRWFKKTAIYRWNDIALLPFVRSDLLPRQEYRSDIAGWINLAYSNFHRPRLAPLAKEIAQHPEQLEDWAKELLVERGFLPDRKPQTWEAYVQLANRAI